MLSKFARPLVIRSKRFGGTFPYFIQRVGGKMMENDNNR